MTWPEFLRELEGHHRVCLVGPMCAGEVSPEFPTILVDGGADHVSPDLAARVPVIALGDGDSTARKMDVLLPQRKNFSDLAFALGQLPPSIRKVDLIGFLGGRRDHELIGLGEVHHFLKRRGGFGRATFDHGTLEAFTNGSLRLVLRGPFSIVVFERSMVTLKGDCEYRLESPTEIGPLSSFGLSNAGFGPVDFSSTNPCFIIRN